MRTISTSSYCPISARSGGTTSSSTASTSSTAVSCEAKGLAYKFARDCLATAGGYRPAGGAFSGRDGLVRPVRKTSPYRPNSDIGIKL